MSLYVLDSDILSLLENGNPMVAGRVAAHGGDEIAVTVITVDESLRGWYSLVRKAKNARQLAQAYDRLARSVSFLSRTKILAFSEAAIGNFEQLRASRLSVRANDLRIAAIALENSATVVTRNIRDFAVVAGVKIEDWSR